MTLGTSAVSSGTSPTRARYWVIVFAVTLSILAYIDRVCISMAAPNMMRDLGLDKVQMGYVFSAFALAYALFEIPGGWMGDAWGPKRVLIRIVLWWSFFTAATGWAWNLVSLWVTRFLFGAGEAGCFPNLTKSFTTWLPAEERVRAQGIMWSFARWGGAFTPPLVILVFRWFDWRHAFLMFGFLGLVWCAFFWAWYKDNPREHKSVNAAEVELLKGAEATAAGHGDVPWERLLFSKTVWLLWLQYFLLAYPWYFYITWLPTYLQEHRGLDPERSSWAAIFPLLFGGFGSLFCGLISARVARWMGSVSLARRWLGSIGFFGAGTLIIVSIQVKDPFLAMMVMGLASFSNDLVMPGAWGACMDVGGKYAGTLSGSMNMMGNLAGFVAPATAGYLLQYTGNWNVPLYVMAGVYLFGTAIWPFIDPVTLLEKTRLMAYDSLFVICGVMQSIPLMFALVFRFRSENATLALAGGSILVAALSVAVSLSLGHIGRRYRGNPMYYRLYGVVGTAGGILVWLASSPLHTGYEIWLWAVISLTHLPWYLFLGYIARKRLGH